MNVPVPAGKSYAGELQLRASPGVRAPGAPTLRLSILGGGVDGGWLSRETVGPLGASFARSVVLADAPEGGAGVRFEVFAEGEGTAGTVCLDVDDVALYAR